MPTPLLVNAILSPVPLNVRSVALSAARVDTVAYSATPYLVGNGITVNASTVTPYVSKYHLDGSRTTAAMLFPRAAVTAISLSGISFGGAAFFSRKAGTAESVGPWLQTWKATDTPAGAVGQSLWFIPPAAYSNLNTLGGTGIGGGTIGVGIAIGSTGAGNLSGDGPWGFGWQQGACPDGLGGYYLSANAAKLTSGVGIVNIAAKTNIASNVTRTTLAGGSNTTYPVYGAPWVLSSDPTGNWLTFAGPANSYASLSADPLYTATIAVSAVNLATGLERFTQFPVNAPFACLGKFFDGYLLMTPGSGGGIFNAAHASGVNYFYYTSDWINFRRIQFSGDDPVTASLGGLVADQFSGIQALIQTGNASAGTQYRVFKLTLDTPPTPTPILENSLRKTTLLNPCATCA